MPAPKAAKKPQDRMPKAVEAAKADALDGTVTLDHNAVTYTVDADAFDDVETFELLGRMQMAAGDEAGLFLPLIVRRVLGEEQWSQFLESNRNERGRVPALALADIFHLLDEHAGNQ